MNDETFIYEYDKFNLNNFKFQNGEILEDVTVEFILKGTPKYDDEGNIINAVIYCPNYDRNCFSINDYPQLTDSGTPFDLNKFFYCFNYFFGCSRFMLPFYVWFKIQFS